MIEGLGDRLKEKRTHYKYSRSFVAETIGISSSVIASYETGFRSPSLEVLVKLADIYHCSTDYLLGVKRAENNIVIETKGLTDAEIEALNHLINAMRK